MHRATTVTAEPATARPPEPASAAPGPHRTPGAADGTPTAPGEAPAPAHMIGSLLSGSATKGEEAAPGGGGPEPPVGLHPGEADAVLRRFELALPLSPGTDDPAAPSRDDLIDYARRILAGAGSADARRPAQARVRGGAAAHAVALLQECALQQVLGQGTVGDTGPGLRRAVEVVRLIGDSVRRDAERPAAAERAPGRRKERTLARELHDELGSSLTTALRRIEVSERTADPRHISAARQAVCHALDHTRYLIKGLRLQTPFSSLDEALESFLARMAPDGVAVDVRFTGGEESAPLSLRRELFMVVRESLRNAFAHSGAGRVTVCVRTNPWWISASVADDGIGFDTGAAHSERCSYGLASMKERVEEMGGWLTVDSAPTMGTVVHVRLPVRTP
ncbi:ATP-binding protein [Nocardiopsis sp. RSe5-2]|uniref:ATP-binding protein n=1 Tax=Nocardiopsis endophytica TaxID=3018445 RepID=A0ABT4TXE9_9ACTN|nr:ATP-binding protein [Nocardiopsis endophytica]MDA2809372.1 ATP-binding protein [Nocardiopsis endophytica]